MLDTTYGIETPEGVDLLLRPSGPGPRVIAWFIDLGVRAAIVAALSIVTLLLGRTGTGLFLVAFFLLEWWYPVAWEVWAHGRTPGKRAMKIRVVSADGTPVGFAASTLRNLLRAADFLPVLNMAALISMVSSRHFCRLGDLVAGTLVVYDEPPKIPTQAMSPSPVPPPVRLTLDEQRALLNFSRRSRSLSRARAQELANLATPLLETMQSSSRHPKEAAEALRGMAAWLQGHRPKGAQP